MGLKKPRHWVLEGSSTGILKTAGLWQIWGREKNHKPCSTIPDTYQRALRTTRRDGEEKN